MSNIEVKIAEYKHENHWYDLRSGARLALVNKDLLDLLEVFRKGENIKEELEVLQILSKDIPVNYDEYIGAKLESIREILERMITLV